MAFNNGPSYSNTASYSYATNPQQSYWPTDNLDLKPIPYAASRPVSITSSTTHNSYYDPLTTYPTHPSQSALDDTLTRATTRDARLKSRIRLLRLISRILALILSAATLAPMTMTLIKFLQTRNTYYVVNGVSRTAWASGTIAWYTYMYFGVSAISFVFNLAIVISYCGRKGTQGANQAAMYAGWWSNGVLVAHVVVWVAATVLYRYGKVPTNGKFRDLWGWSCSKAADAIQPQITDVNFAQYCTIQTTSFVTGVANTAAGILSGVIYIFVFMRLRSKKSVRNASFRVDEAREPLRQ